VYRPLFTLRLSLDCAATAAWRVDTAAARVAVIVTRAMLADQRHGIDTGRAALQ
jgi:hypothetical protein